MKSEYMAFASISAELVWLQALFVELGVKIDPNPLVIWCDNMGTASLASNTIFHARKRHIKVDAHFMREKVANNEVEVIYVPTHEQATYMFTMPMAIPQSAFLRSKLNLLAPM